MPTDRERLLELLTQLQIGSEALAKHLEMDAHMLRKMMSGREPVPRMVILALEKMLYEKKGGAPK